MKMTQPPKQERGKLLFLSLLFIFAAAVMASLPAQEPQSSDSEPAAAVSEDSGENVGIGLSHSFFDLIKAGGWIGAVIFLLSLWGCAEAIRLFFLLRRSQLLPESLQEKFQTAMESGNFRNAPGICEENPSFLASVLIGGLRNAEGGWKDIEKGVEETLESETARLYRKTDFLALVGNIAPMLGLLGTVLGMVAAFGELAVSDGLGRFANLAQGIYLALVTTVDGLLAAIPALALCAFFNHRIAELVSDAAELTEQLTLPLKEYYRKRNTPAVARPVPQPRSQETRPVPPPLPPSHKENQI